MYVQLKKVVPWIVKDYVKVILCFFVNYVILGVLCALATFINKGMRWEAFSGYFLSEQGKNNFAYLMIALFLLMVVIFLFYYNENRDFIKKPKNVVMMFLIVFVSLIISYCVGMWGSVYARPIALCALLTLMLVNRSSAIFMNFAMCMITFLMDIYTGADYFGEYQNAEFSSLVIGFSAGLIGIYLISGIKSRVKVLVMGLVVSVPIILMTFVLEGMDFNRLYLPVFTGITAGMLSVALQMVLLPAFEFVFNVLTDYRLSEITDHKYKVMKKLIELAPGTFNHCLIVSNLAETCATAIGESSQVARAAAYYHDIGKIRNPGFFTENQQGKDYHEDLTPELSAQIIMSHTTEGAKILKRYRLPQILVDVAQEHQGTMHIRYFYAEAVKMTDGEVDIKKFSYPGPKPQSKIAAIIMIADASEAKVRTLKDRSHVNVDAAVKEIIEERMDADQFSDCDLTIRDLSIIRSSLVNALAGVYHDRVEYPKLKIGKSKKK